MPLWIFTSAKVFPPVVNFPFYFCMILVIKFKISCDIFYFFKHFIIQVCETKSKGRQSIRWLHFPASLYSPCGCSDQCKACHMFLLFPWRINFVLQEKSLRYTCELLLLLLLLLLLILILLLFHLLPSFHTSVSWWFFNRVWVIASFLCSSGLFSVFLPI